MKKNTTTTIISTHKHDDMYFAVGFTEKGKIIRITLPQTNIKDAISEITKYYPNFRVSDENSNTVRKICRMFLGEDVDFDFDLLEFEIKKSGNEKSTISTPFERDVILEVGKIPKGSVKTYKEIADSLNSRAYRAVGSAIGKNPFPIVIPCHRVIRSDGKIGGFRGGTQMKIEILKNEGIKIDNLKILDKKKK